MRPDRWFLVGLVLLAACGKPEPTSKSAKARVTAKSGAVWGRDLATGLGLQTWELCSELGTYDCIGEAHLVTLGGVEPTVLGIDEPLPNASVSAPIAADRVAAAACGERFVRDRAGGPVLFGPVLEKDGKAQRQDVTDNLVRRLLAREPTDADREALEALHGELEGTSSDLVRDWSVGACVVVATSTEALFY